jgi:hypothetical protein
MGGRLRTNHNSGSLNDRLIITRPGIMRNSKLCVTSGLIYRNSDMASQSSTIRNTDSRHWGT